MGETKVCRKCKIERERTYTGFKKGDGTKLFKDDTGRRWGGRLCSRCFRKDDEKAKVKAIKLQKVEFKVQKKAAKYGNRKCQKCKQRLTKDRYFHCYNCVPHLTSDFSLQDVYGACTISGTTLRY